jgi:tetratricopeptide (TPR) repeat protein
MYLNINYSKPKSSFLFNQTSNPNMTQDSKVKDSSRNDEEKNNKKEVNLDDYLCNDKNKIALKKLEKIKNEGNSLFKASKFNQACERYYEAINELQYLSRDKDISCLKEVEDLEDTCRLNIATCKLKGNDFDSAVNECLKVLKKNPNNFKAHWKAGNAFFNKKNYEKALFHFESFKKLNPNQEVEQGKLFYYKNFSRKLFN